MLQFGHPPQSVQCTKKAKTIQIAQSQKTQRITFLLKYFPTRMDYQAGRTIIVRIKNKKPQTKESET
ncbi:TPA: hypothetical protein DDW35_07635 [Candidatus Sumerlaeota bacterium]|nr:hypothetical protein [Candidatus Sumerlaeota bacterium]